MFGGELIPVNEDYPWVVLILTQISRIYTKVCTGSVIAPNWVLTAAHCLQDEGRSVPDSAVTINVYWEVKNFHRYRVVRVFRHPNFGGIGKKYYRAYTSKLLSTLLEFQNSNDIGLIRTREAMKVDSGVIRQSTDYPNTSCTLIGFGQSERANMGPTLAKMRVNLMPENLCQGFDPLGNRLLCLMAVDGIGPCVGDSGSPMICDGQIAGVCSRGLFSNDSDQSCGLFEFAIVIYEKVDKGWISNIIRMHPSSGTLHTAWFAPLAIPLVLMISEWS